MYQIGLSGGDSFPQDFQPSGPGVVLAAHGRTMHHHFFLVVLSSSCPRSCNIPPSHLPEVSPLFCTVTLIATDWQKQPRTKQANLFSPKEKLTCVAQTSSNRSSFRAADPLHSCLFIFPGRGVCLPVPPGILRRTKFPYSFRVLPLKGCCFSSKS